MLPDTTPSRPGTLFIPSTATKTRRVGRTVTVHGRERGIDTPETDTSKDDEVLWDEMFDVETAGNAAEEVVTTLGRRSAPFVTYELFIWVVHVVVTGVAVADRFVKYWSVIG